MVQANRDGGVLDKQEEGEAVEDLAAVITEAGTTALGNLSDEKTASTAPTLDTTREATPDTTK